MNSISRRDMLRLSALGLAGVAGSNWLVGCGGASEGGASNTGGSSGGPIRIGFIPLTDCASVAMAHELGLYQKYGVDVIVEKQTSWPIVRDKLASGELHAAHCLWGMPFATATGVSAAPGDDLKIAMTINNNGQATTLSQKMFGDGSIGYADYAGFGRKVQSMIASGTPPTFAMTFPGGTHDIWLLMTLAAAGIDPTKVRINPVPPPQMVANMEAGNMDGFNVGEPWGGVAASKGLGFSFVATQTLWKHHPEKALVVNGRFAEERRDDLKKVMMAVLEASQWLDDMTNRAQAATAIGGAAYVNAESAVIDARLMGDYDLGGSLGKMQFTEDTMLFHRGGETNFPRYAYGIWFMTQYARFGRLPALPAEMEAIARRVIMQDLYTEVATEMGIPIPQDDMSPFMVDADQGMFDPSNPTGALAQYAHLLRERKGGFA